jgi:hypothetical protein
MPKVPTASLPGSPLGCCRSGHGRPTLAAAVHSDLWHRLNLLAVAEHYVICGAHPCPAWRLPAVEACIRKMRCALQRRARPTCLIPADQIRQVFQREAFYDRCLAY